MPYLTPENRYALAFRPPESSGELNFIFTSIIDTYLTNEGLRYETINDVLGALEGAKLEFYRRVAVPYESSKITQNGDVYTVDIATGLL